MPATLDDARAKEIRNRLLYARFRLLHSDEWNAAESEAYAYLEANGITGRTREKLLSLITVAILWDELDAFEPFVEAVCEQDQEAVANSEDARFVQVLRDLALEEIEETAILTDGDPFAAVAVPYTEIVERYESVSGIEKSASWVGHIRDRLDFEKERKRDGTVIQDPELGSKLQQLCEEHNLNWESSDSTEADPQPSNPKGSGDTKRVKTRIKDLLREEYGQRATVTPESAGEAVGTNTANARAALDTLATETRLLEKTNDGYRVLGGEA